MDISAPLTSSRPAPPGGRRRGPAKHSSGTNTPDSSSHPSPIPSSHDFEHPHDDDGGHGDDDDRIPTSDTHDTLRPLNHGHSHAHAHAHSASSADDDMTKEEIEQALAGLTTDDLFLALRRAKVEIDRLDAVVSSQTLEIETVQSSHSDLSSRLIASESEVKKLNAVVHQREARVDELTMEQEKMEDEIYKKLGILERLKARADESERKVLETERKVADMLQSADKEREYYQNQETLLKSQNTRLTKDNQNLKEEALHLRETVDSLMQQVPDQTSAVDDTASLADGNGLVESQEPSTEVKADTQEPKTPLLTATRKARAPSSPLLARPLSSEKPIEDTNALQTELEQLRKTLQSQDAALHELRNNLANERNRSLELENEKTELESMLTGNTLEQLMKSKAAQWAQSERSETDSSYAESSALSEDIGEHDASDDVPDVPTTPKPRPARGPRSSSALRRKRSLEQVPEALSDELGLGQEANDAEKANMSVNTTELQNELLRLRHENKNLAMYINKILNRILSMEGFERVLAADSLGADGGKTLRGTMGRKNKPRHTVLPTQSAEKSKETSRKDRRKSAGGILSFARNASPLLSGSPTMEDSSSSSSSTTSPSKPARGTSVDWRNFKLPWSAGSDDKDKDKANANLRPLALSTSGSRLDNTVLEADSSTGSLEPRQIGPDGLAIEDPDELERQRARTLLQMEGHSIPEHQLNPIPPSAKVVSSPTMGAGGFGAFFSRVMGANDGSAPGQGQAPPAPSSSSASAGGRSATPSSEAGATASAHSRSPSLSSTVSSIKPDSGSNASGHAPVQGQGTASLTEFARPKRPRRPVGSKARLSSASANPSSEFDADADADASSGSLGRGAAEADDSVAGDESYAQYGDAAAEGDDAKAEPTWRKALKRMSFLGGEPPERERE